MGAALGFTPAQVRDMSMWELSAAVDGWVEANSSEDTSMSAEEEDDLWAWMQAKPLPSLNSAQ